MTMYQNASKKRYYLFVLAIFMPILGAVAFFMGSDSFVIRSVGLAALMVSVQLVRLSKVHAIDQKPVPVPTNFPGRLMWIIGIALLVAMGIASLFLHYDALNGYHEILPVYAFAGISIVCTVFWFYLLSRIF